MAPLRQKRGFAKARRGRNDSKTALQNPIQMFDQRLSHHKTGRKDRHFEFGVDEQERGNPLAWAEVYVKKRGFFTLERNLADAQAQIKMDQVSYMPLTLKPVLNRFKCRILGSNLGSKNLRKWPR